MKNKSLFLFIVLFFNNILLAQLETAHWYFGNRFGLNFTSGSPVLDTKGQLSPFEGCGSISDSKGNLLFYTDGRVIYNRDHME